MIPVVIAFTPNYFVPAAVTLKSLLEASGGDFHIICLVTEDIPELMQEKLRSMGGGRLEFEYINLGGRLKDVYIDARYSEAASFRLLLPELLPEYDKVLYTDCDIIIRQDVARLFEETDLEDNWLGAVYEAPIENQAERFRALGCNPREYFNSGFLLMNLAAMREGKVSEKLLAACRVDWLEFPDQDALNQVCQGHVLPLSPVYNGIRTFFLPQYKADFISQYGSGALWDEVQDSGTIHYTGGKPWNIFSVKFGEWWKVYDSLPEEIKVEWTPNGKIHLIWKIYKTGSGRALIEVVRRLYRLFHYESGKGLLY